MTAPGMRQWSRHTGPRLLAGGLIAAGLLLMIATQLFLPAFATAGLILGAVLVVAGGLGIVLLR